MVTTFAPAVSIAIRAYRRRWLAEAIASVLNQTWRDLELVIYDDAGDLEDVASAFGDGRIRYHRATERLGASGRFLAALALARGRYLGLLDDDDRYEATFVERLVEVLEQERDVGVAFCRTTWEANGTRYCPTDPRPAGRQRDTAADIIAYGRIMSPSLMLMRRAAFDAAQRAQPMPDGVAPDVFINVRIALAGWQHWLVDEQLAILRWHADQLSRRGLPSRDVAVATWNALRVGDSRLAALQRQQLARAHLLRGITRVHAGDGAGALADVSAAATVSPSLWPLGRTLLASAARAGSIGRAACVGLLSLPRFNRLRTYPPPAVGSWQPGATLRFLDRLSTQTPRD